MLRRASVAFASVCLVVLSTSSVARAQALGFVGGGSVDPEQFYVGTFFETPPLAESVRVRPGVDGSWGDGVRAAAISFDVIYGDEVSSGWGFYSGGGPTVFITRVDESAEAADSSVVNDVTGGLGGLIGLSHASGLFVEFRFLHVRNAPALKLGAGFKFGGGS
jgi:hypothetical protein